MCQRHDFGKRQLFMCVYYVRYQTPMADTPLCCSRSRPPGDEQWAGGGAGLLVGGAAEEARGLGRPTQARSVAVESPSPAI